MTIDDNVENAQGSGCLGCLDTLATGTVGVTGAGIGGYLGTQVPQFLNQYLDQLHGHVSEAHHAMQNNPGIVNLVERYNDLKTAFIAIKDAETPWRLWEFIKNYDHEIAKDTLNLYNHGISFDSDTAVYGGILAVAGAALAVGGYKIAKGIVSNIFK